MAHKKVWIEVALNGAWPRALQPNKPFTIWISSAAAGRPSLLR